MIKVPRFQHLGESLSGGQIARLRWIWLAALTMTIMLAALFFDAEPPVAAVTATLLFGIVANLLAMRRPAAITAPLILDVVLLGALLGVFGALANPFAALLPAPAFVGAISIDPRSARPVAAVVIVVTSLLVFTGGSIVTATWLTICAMAGLAALTGRISEVVAKARRDAVTALAQERVANATGLAFAAAAHEIASPLATIRIAAAELARDAGDRAETREDALLIGREALRCGAILDAVRGPPTVEDPLLISEIVARAASPHHDRGIGLRIRSDGTGPEPRIDHPEDAILGLRNIIQNAVDFARSDVDVEIRWTAEAIEMAVSDDGDGFAADILAGSPPEPGRPRPRGGPGTGSGLALGRALLARGGGVIALDPAPPTGARVRVTWGRTAEHG